MFTKKQNVKGQYFGKKFSGKVESSRPYLKNGYEIMIVLDEPIMISGELRSKVLMHVFGNGNPMQKDLRVPHYLRDANDYDDSDILTIDEVREAFAGVESNELVSVINVALMSQRVLSPQFEKDRWRVIALGVKSLLDDRGYKLRKAQNGLYKK